MLRKLLVVAVVVAALGVATTLAAPQPFYQTGIDLPVNIIFRNISETIPLSSPFIIDANQPNVMEFTIEMHDATITGVNGFVSSGSSLTIVKDGIVELLLNIKSPKVTLNTPHYTISGSMVDHIALEGSGPAMISVDEMAVTVTGSGNITATDLSTVVFTDASIDLEMWRWWVDFEGLMPGTDLGTVFNEFMMMCGPEIFDTIENNLNESGNLVKFMNNIVSAVTGNGFKDWNVNFDFQT